MLLAAMQQEVEVILQIVMTTKTPRDLYSSHSV